MGEILIAGGDAVQLSYFELLDLLGTELRTLYVLLVGVGLGIVVILTSLNERFRLTCSYSLWTTISVPSFGPFWFAIGSVVSGENRPSDTVRYLRLLFSDLYLDQEILS